MQLKGVINQEIIKGQIKNVTIVTGGGGGSVASVFGRTGVIVGQAGDYTANLITVSPSGNLSSLTVQNALLELQGDIDTQDTALASKQNALTWVTVISDITLQNNSGYIVNGLGVRILTLPLTAEVGSEIEILGNSAPNWRIVVNAGQIIKMGKASTTVSIESSDQYDTVKLRCIVANTEWRMYPAQGNPTFN